MRVFDLTRHLDDQVQTRDENALCADLDHECASMDCHLTCWLSDPTQGICPFFSGGKNDQR